MKVVGGGQNGTGSARVQATTGRDSGAVEDEQ
jgi:glycerol-3-phosphate dehydrogenase